MNTATCLKSPSVTAYKAGFSKAEVLLETQGLYSLDVPVEVEIARQEAFDIVEGVNICEAFTDGFLDACMGREPLTMAQIESAYD